MKGFYQAQANWDNAEPPEPEFECKHCGECVDSKDDLYYCDGVCVCSECLEEWEAEDE